MKGIVSFPGISGWFPINLPSLGWHSNRGDDRHDNRGLERVVGGLEMTVKFAHLEDRERVVHCGRSLGWSPEMDLDEEEWDSAGRFTYRIHLNKRTYFEYAHSFFLEKKTRKSGRFTYRIHLNKRIDPQLTQIFLYLCCL